MNKKQKPQLKLFLSKDAFNTFISMLNFYIASEAQAGKTFYSQAAAKFMNQFINYGNFIQKKNEADDIFMIYLYEIEVMKIMRMYNKYISIHQSPGRDFFAEYKQNKKSIT